jgi:poly-gamma-glutamate synthesis protein (capsule biosynthesis protein)
MAGGAADGGGLRLALTGDLIHTRRLAPLVETDDGLAAIVRLLRGADATFGNLEVAIADRDDADAWVWSVYEDWTIAGEPHAIEDLRALGFSFVGRANNHAMDRGPAGMRTTGRLLDAAGVVHAGAGEDLARARSPRFLETPRGRVALVSATTSPSPVDVAPALDAFAGLPSRPGVHAIRLRASVTVPPEAHAALRAVHDQMSDAAGEWMLGEEDLHLFRTRFTEGTEVAIAYEPAAQDVAAAMRAVRQGRQQADVAVFAVHAHEGDRDPARPMPHLRDLAHAAIDAGADVVVISGPHVMCPVEAYAGRPILYGLGNFVWSDVGGPLSLDFWERTGAAMGDRAPDPAHATEAELIALLNRDGFADPWVFRAVVAEVVFGHGLDVRLHPVDLGFGAPVTVSGVPRAANPAVAEEIVARLADLSAPYGASIGSIDGLGVLHL